MYFLLLKSTFILYRYVLSLLTKEPNVRLETYLLLYNLTLRCSTTSRLIILIIILVIILITNSRFLVQISPGWFNINTMQKVPPPSPRRVFRVCVRRGGRGVKCKKCLSKELTNIKKMKTGYIELLHMLQVNWLRLL